MAPPPDRVSADWTDFELDEWRVQPSLNRLRRGEATVRIEPKQMDVLTFLARHAGQVVSKDDLAAAVWPGVFVTESVITRAIAGLRRALEDDARQPRFIETIAKRGYRLLAVPATAAGGPLLVSPPPARVRPTPAPRAPASRASPYAVGQWVRAERFYGREAEIAEVLHGPRNGLWLLGSRAIGKTSLLKHLEHLAAGDASLGYFPVFWDLQGSDDPERLQADFQEALAEAEGRLAALGLDLREVGGEDFFGSLGRLRRNLAARGRTLLLLLDEAEELVRLQARSPALLRKLRRALLAQDGVRTVLASSSRLWQLGERPEDTSPFLHGFAPPLYLGSLDEAAARRLVRQAQGEPASALADEPVVEEILRRSGRHPYLLQVLAARTHELGDLDRATDAVAADPGVRFFFAVDFDLLSEAERGTLRALAVHAGAAAVEALGIPASPADLAAGRLHLERLGVVRRSPDGGVDLASPILRRWLAEWEGQKL